MMNGLSDGMVKVLEVLGDRLESLENSERWVRQDADKTKKELDMCREECSKTCIENMSLKEQLSEMGEKIAEYERAVIIDNDGNLVQFKDLPEIEIPGELEKEIQESLDRGKAPGKVAE